MGEGSGRAERVGEERGNNVDVKEEGLDVRVHPRGRWKGSVTLREEEDEERRVVRWVGSRKEAKMELGVLIPRD